MAGEFSSGARDEYASHDDIILDLKDGLDYLKPKNDGVGLIKRLGMNGFRAKQSKVEWDETKLAVRKETITCTDVATDITVADAYQYSVDNVLKVESEIMLVTAIKDANEITVTRGIGDTDAAAHNAKTMLNLGTAKITGSAAGTARSDTPVRLYNYVQTFDDIVEMTNDEIASAHTEGNPLTGRLKRSFIETIQRFSNAFFYGVRYDDTSAKRKYMGGLTQYIATNVTDASAAAGTAAMIDAEIAKIVEAGGDPKVLAVGLKQAQRLGVIDASLIRYGIRDKVSGTRRIGTWQSTILDHDLEVFVDMTILPDQMFILDTDYIEIGHYTNNGKVGTWHVIDATTPGSDHEKKRLIGKYTVRVRCEKSCALIKNLAVTW